MAKKVAKRKKVIRKKKAIGRRKAGRAAVASESTFPPITDVPPASVGQTVQDMIDLDGASDIRVTVQSNAMWTVRRLA